MASLGLAALIICLALLVALLPTMAFAAGKSAIQLGAGGGRHGKIKRYERDG